MSHKWVLNTAKPSLLFNTKNHNECKSQDFPPKQKHVLICKSFVEKMKLQFPTMKWSLKTDLVLL